MFAVIETGGKQYVVKSGDTLSIEKLDVVAGQEMIFDQVLLVAEDDGSSVNVGAPRLDGAKVTATVLEHGRARKIRVVKFKNKVRYKRANGHRQNFTKVKIAAIA